MTQQEIVNHVCTHLLTQNRKASSIIQPVCRYRISSGDGVLLRCAAGCLIPDEDYDPDFEAQVIMPRGDINTVTLYFTKRFGKENLPLIKSLQIVHDNVEVRLWPKELSNVCRPYGLAVPKIVVDRLENLSENLEKS